MQPANGAYIHQSKQLFDIDNNSASQLQRPKPTKKKNQSQNPNQECEISPEFVSNQDESSDSSSCLNNIQRLNSQDRLPQIDVIRARSPPNLLENQLQPVSNTYHLPPIVQS